MKDWVIGLFSASDKTSEKMDNLKYAHEQGFLSDADFKERMAKLSGDYSEKTANGWLVGLFIKAIENLSSEQDRLDLLAWLALARETLADESLSKVDTFSRLYGLIDFKKSIGAVFKGVGEAVKNYASSDLPWALKVSIPVTLAAATVVGGEAVGIAGFGSAIGLPVLLLVFIGVAGITAILEAFLSHDAADSYIGVIMALIAQDEVLRRANHALKTAMQAEPVAPKKQVLSKDAEALKADLLAMNPYDFERHIMAFFQDKGMLAWVTKQSNDAGVDGFARHTDGLVVVQCKRNAEDNPVGRPVVQQFKGVVEENAAYLGYIVTTSSFTQGAVESAALNERLRLVDMVELLVWHGV